MKWFGLAVATIAISLGSAERAHAQELPWIADGSIGYAGFVDDSTRNFLVLGGAVRKQVTPRISVGPEFIFMDAGDSFIDRAVMLTGNVVFDFYPTRGANARTMTPFLVGGVGGFWQREQLGTGPFWSSDPAFTAGGGVRARLSERVSAVAEYRFGWELHQRLSGSVSFDF
jgi:hypothetical protein